jgi:hypothetical protein
MSFNRRTLRNVSRRVVIELIVVVLLVGVPIDFPRSVPAGAAWSFLLRHPSALLHAAIGILVLAEAAILAVRVLAPRRPSRIVLAGVGLGFTLLAFAAGIGYVGGGQSDTALTLMSTGWLAALVTYIVGWVAGRREMRALRQPADRAEPRPSSVRAVRRTGRV